MNLLVSTALLASLAVGIDTGYEPAPEGGLEYIIQIPPDILPTLKPGEAITSEIPHDLKGVTRYRIQVGNDRLPRIQLPGSFDPAGGSVIQQTSGGSVQPTNQTPPLALNQQSPFQSGANTNSAGYADDRYSQRTATASPTGTGNFAANTTAATGQEITELPLKLPPPPDGYPDNYMPGGQANTGMQQVPPANNNQPVQPQPNTQPPNNQWANQPNAQWQNPQQTAPPNWNNQTWAAPNNVPYGYNGPMMPGMVNNGYQQPGIMQPNYVPAVQGYPQGYAPGYDPRLVQGGMAQVPQGTYPSQPRLAENTNDGKSSASTPFIANNSEKTDGDTPRKVSFREETSEASPSEKLKAAVTTPVEKPWLPMYVTGFAAVGSLLGNLYLAWMWLETRRRYRQIILERTLAV